jgi:hypothetical protein
MISPGVKEFFGLSSKGARVLSALQEGHNTPLKIARETKVSRPGVYDMLLDFKRRGLVESRITDGRKHWKLLERKELEKRFFEVKRAILGISEGTNEVFGLDDAVVVTYRGKEAVKKVLTGIFLEHKNERLYGFQGDVAANKWNDLFSASETNRINQHIKKNALIVDAMLPEGWFERQIKEFGTEWATEFEGRATRTSLIPTEYFAHGGQLFIFKDSIYLLALGEELVIEIRNSEIQKMLLAFFKFMQDNSQVIDANELLRNIIAETSGEEAKNK